jgi:hypothetical protein
MSFTSMPRTSLPRAWRGAPYRKARGTALPGPGLLATLTLRTQSLPMSQPHAPVPNNRRVGRRTGLRRPCELHLPDQSVRKAITSDIGVDGMSFVCAKPIPPGTRCRISFELPLGERGVPIQAAMKTVYSSYCGADGFRIGAVFTELDGHDAEVLSDFAAPDL